RNLTGRPIEKKLGAQQEAKKFKTTFPEGVYERTHQIPGGRCRLVCSGFCDLRSRSIDNRHPRRNRSSQSRNGGTSVRISQSFIWTLLVVCTCLSVVTGGAAQSTTGVIFGDVKDQSGAVLPGVDITVLNVATNQTRTAVTTETGAYNVPLVPIGQ